MYRPSPVSAIILLVFGFSSPESVVANNNNYRFSIAQSLNNFDSRTVSSWSKGGGSIANLTNSTGYPFAGRPYGSGDRSTIYGSRAYGSGYSQWSYPVTDPTSVAGRGFPYGVWPIPWAGDYAGSGEYGAESVDIFRPGGVMVQVPLKSGPDRWNASSLEETYWIIGDRDSIISIMASMVDWCHAEPIWPDTFNPAESAIDVAGDATGQGVRLHPGNILQYYRASTFALAHPAYNNSYAYFPLNTSTLLTHDQSTPLNNVMKHSAWLRCINETIANALPILDNGPPDDNNSISLAFFLVLIVVCGIISTYLCILAPRHIPRGNCLMRIRQIPYKKEAALARRNITFDFQNYP